MLRFDPHFLGYNAFDCMEESCRATGALPTNNGRGAHLEYFRYDTEHVVDLVCRLEAAFQHMVNSAWVTDLYD